MTLTTAAGTSWQGYGIRDGDIVYITGGSVTGISLYTEYNIKVLGNTTAKLNANCVDWRKL